jgi:hypothetical protein
VGASLAEERLRVRHGAVILGCVLQASQRISGIADVVERWRPQHPHPERSQGRVREIVVVTRELLLMNGRMATGVAWLNGNRFTER